MHDPQNSTKAVDTSERLRQQPSRVRSVQVFAALLLVALVGGYFAGVIAGSIGLAVGMVAFLLMFASTPIGRGRAHRG
jgi:hypothetical protein